MFGGLNRLLMVTAVAGAALAAVLAGPAVAAGCGNSTSAVNVYHECTQNGGGKSSAGGKGSQTGATQPLPSQTQKALNQAGNDRKTLSKLVTAYGLNRQLEAVHGGSDSSPSAVGSAFDLTSGPTALLIVLAGSALLLLGGSGMRVWRSRRRA